MKSCVKWRLQFCTNQYSNFAPHSVQCIACVEPSFISSLLYSYHTTKSAVGSPQRRHKTNIIIIISPRFLHPKNVPCVIVVVGVVASCTTTYACASSSSLLSDMYSENAKSILHSTLFLSYSFCFVKALVKIELTSQFYLYCTY